MVDGVRKEKERLTAGINGPSTEILFPLIWKTMHQETDPLQAMATAGSPTTTVERLQTMEIKVRSAMPQLSSTKKHEINSFLL